MVGIYKNTGRNNPVIWDFPAVFRKNGVRMLSNELFVATSIWSFSPRPLTFRQPANGSSSNGFDSSTGTGSTKGFKATFLWYSYPVPAGMI